MRTVLIIIGCVVVAFAGALLLPRLIGETNERDQIETRSNVDDRAPVDPDDSQAPPPPSIDEAKAAARGGLDAMLAIAARQVNAAGPIAIDDLTTMTEARAEGNRLIYRYELGAKVTPEQLASFRQIATSENRRVVCERPETRTMLDMGAELEYEYFAANGERLFSTPITGC